MTNMNNATEMPKVLITARPEAPKEGTVLPTIGANDQLVVTQSWWAQVLIRVFRTYLQSLLGFITILSSDRLTEAVGLKIPAGDFGGLLVIAASLAVAPAAMAFIQNAIEILAKLDVSNPKVRA